MKLRIYIATTDGPSEIQSIVEEDPDISSVVCLNGSTQALPITPGYDAFVRKPTGVIERLTGHRVYRTDVSHPITNGNSWQLGLYLAHALEREGRLAQKGEDANAVLLVTGAISARDLKVEAVGHIPEKLSHTGALMLESSAQGLPLTIFLPEDDLDEQALIDLPPNVDVFSVSHVEEALSALEMAKEQPPEPESEPETPVAEPEAPMADAPEPTQSVPLGTPDQIVEGPRKGKAGRLVLAALGLGLLAGGAYGYQQWQEGPVYWAQLQRDGRIDALEKALNQAEWPWLVDYFKKERQGSAADDSAINLTIRGLTPADGQSCAGMRFRNTSLKAESFRADKSKLPAHFCKLEFELRNHSGEEKQVWAAVMPKMVGMRFRARDEGLQLYAGKLKGGESIVMPVNLPKFRSSNLKYGFFALSFGQESEDISGKFYNAVENSLIDEGVFRKYRAYGLSLTRAELSVGSK